MDHSELAIGIEHLSVSFDGEKVIHDLSFRVEEGETLAIVGPNGSGKTTLLRAILGLVEYRGNIRIKDGMRRMGYVPQRFTMDRDLPLSVEEFLSLRERRSNPEKIRDTLRLIEFPERLLARAVGSLSGGELQRLLIIWTLVDDPSILLFDEPTAWVDIKTEEMVFALLRRLREERNLTVILVSHDLNVVYREASTVLCLNKEIVCHGSPQEVLTPASLARLYGGEPLFYKHEHISS